ncbi:hypothetical protein EQH57_0593 [Dictyocoela roeselum]|nr:hypothetical protein EQH57_0593 [Dictyocoela roeselum]
MVFSYSLYANGNNKDRKPNQRGKASTKPVLDRIQEQYQESLRNQSDPTAFLHREIPRARLLRGMDLKEAEIQLFMICRRRSFKELDLDDKILYIVEQTDKSIQKWYFEKGSSNNLPDTLEKFIDEPRMFIKERRYYHRLRGIQMRSGLTISLE